MRVKVKQLKRLLREGALPQLEGLVAKIRMELPMIMNQWEWQVDLSELMKAMDIKPEEAEVFKHLITDPENTGGIALEINDNNFVFPADDMQALGAGQPSPEDPTDPSAMDSSEFGNPPGTSPNIDFEMDRDMYNPDDVGGIRNFASHAEKGGWHFPKGEAPGHNPQLEDGYVAPPPREERKSWDEQTQEERDADMESEDAYLKQLRQGQTTRTTNESRKPKKTITVGQLKEFISKEVSKVLKSSAKKNK